MDILRQVRFMADSFCSGYAGSNETIVSIISGGQVHREKAAWYQGRPSADDYHAVVYGHAPVIAVFDDGRCCAAARSK